MATGLLASMVSDVRGSRRLAYTKPLYLRVVPDVLTGMARSSAGAALAPCRRSSRAATASKKAEGVNGMDGVSGPEESSVMDATGSEVNPWVPNAWLCVRAFPLQRG